MVVPAEHVGAELSRPLAPHHVDDCVILFSVHVGQHCKSANARVGRNLRDCLRERRLGIERREAVLDRLLPYVVTADADDRDERRLHRPRTSAEFDSAPVRSDSS